ncbi:MAG: YbaB/EbfC family nucleoid-associated protein [Patescibacteria group bacterium]|nr:YbaB/EbfC family nucleoid-associated protein [Patescibacteria group bacterium]
MVGFGQMRELMKLQSQAKKMQKELRQTVVEAEGEGGKIKVEINGEQNVQNIEIDESLLEPQNKTNLERALVRTLQEGSKAIQKIVAQKGKSMMGGGLGDLLK